MSFVDHLTELRSRVIRIVGIVFISFMLTYAYGEYIAEFLLYPLRNALGDQGKIVYLGVLDKVLAQLQISFWSSIILSAPLWFYQIWLFIKPGLYEKEVKVIRPFVLVGFLLFILGVCFGYFIVFPLTFETLLGFGVQNLDAMLDFKTYLVLASKVLVLLGFLFQLPNILLILGFMEVVTKYSLKSWRRYLYVAFAVLAAVLTPPDPITMMGLWIPLVVLYELGIIAVSLIVHPYLKRKYA